MDIAFYSIVPLNYFKEATTLTIIGMARELKKLGHNVVIIAQKVDGLPEYQNIEGIPIYRKYALGKVLSYPFTLRKVQKQTNLKFDIIHGFSSTPLFVCSGFLSKFFFPKAKIVHSIKSYSRSRITNYLYPLLNLADRVTVPTNIFVNKLNFVKKSKISLLRSPVNLEKFYPKDKNILKEKYGYIGKKIIFYYGSFHEHKGVSNLIKAIPELIMVDGKNEENEIKIIFAPRYAHIPKERALVEKLKMKEYVEFITHDVVIEDYVNLADVVVLPYNSMVATEGNPSCLLEAMACKTPVVTVNLPELREIVTPEVDVLMANVQDISDLAKQIKRVLIDKELQKKLIQNAYLKVISFDINLITKDLIKIYKS